MKKLGLLLTAIALLVFIGCKENKKKDAEEVVVEETVKAVKEAVPSAVAFVLESKNESTATGKVEFTAMNGVVKLEVKLSGLTPGKHAIHIHEKADCSSPDGKSAGGHWNPTMAPHGKWGAAEGFHKGDIGNVIADENGAASLSMKTDEWCIGCGDEKQDILGKAIIVHQGTDDYTTQPTGAAGGRVSCGGIIQ